MSQVSVRVRPLNGRERDLRSLVITTFSPPDEIILTAPGDKNVKRLIIYAIMLSHLHT